MERKKMPVVMVAVVALVAIAASIGLASTAPASASAASKQCAKYSGTVLLTYSNPQTIILHIIRGTVNAATTFTMTPSTTYLRNGTPSAFADVKIGDTGTITATEQIPSGTLLACSVTVSGP
jgi:hypothetical protein